MSMLSVCLSVVVSFYDRAWIVGGSCLWLRKSLHLLLKIYRAMDASYGFGPQRMGNSTQSAQGSEVSIEVPIALSCHGTLVIRSNICSSSYVSERRNGLCVWIRQIYNHNVQCLSLQPTTLHTQTSTHPRTSTPTPTLTKASPPSEA